MLNEISIKLLFPREEEIPNDCRMLAPIHQAITLLDGELVPVKDGVRKVFSPICVQDGDRLRQLEIGSIPVGSLDEAAKALQAAVAAYDRGRGQWPTMNVAERIACMQDFTRRMVAQRQQIVNLIMWEIGKSLSDSEKEFDRTVSYINATIDALRDLATLIPALIMGNTVVFKPPRFGVLLFYPLLEAFRAAFPKGVINTTYGKGSEVVPFLLNSGEINVLTLIGSSKVADHLKKQHPKANRLRAVLGLDAKNAAIVVPTVNHIRPY